MKQGFAIWLVIGALFALWLYNTGRVASFKNWLQTTPGQPTLPTGGRIRTSSSGPGTMQTAACASAAASGIVEPDCIGTFFGAVSDPLKTISQGVSTLTLGLIKL